MEARVAETWAWRPDKVLRTVVVGLIPAERAILVSVIVRVGRRLDWGVEAHGVGLYRFH